MDDARARLGQVVISRAGRDIGTRYLVIRILASPFVAVADGRSKTAGHPKRKNLRHLELTPEVVPELAERLEAGVQVDDHAIREVLVRIRDKEGGSVTDVKG